MQQVLTRHLYLTPLTTTITPYRGGPDVQVSDFTHLDSLRHAVVSTLYSNVYILYYKLV